MAHYRTTYELVADDGQRRLLAGYTRKSRRGMMDMIRHNADKWASVSDSFTFGKKGSDGCTLGPFRIFFSGRTKIEAEAQGELTWFADALSLS